MYLKKMRKVIRNGNLIRFLLNRNLFFELKRLQKQVYRIKSSSLSRKCRTTIEKQFSDCAAVTSRVRTLFGDVSAFPELTAPGDKARIVDQADRYLQHRFDILGSGETQLDPIDWHTDFKTGFRWKPGTFYLDYVQVDAGNNADVKIPRELSRCHHFLVLGQAYLLTNNEKYVKEFIHQTTDFIDDNPLMRSINWGCTMDVAIRAANWIRALSLFISSPSLKKDFLITLMTSLFEHGHFIYMNPEIAHYPENRHNHYIADLAGQIYLGLLFRGLPEADSWLEKGIRSFFLEMRLQILPSGPTYERSTNYHRLVLEMFCSVIVLLKKNGFEIPSDIWFRLEKMFEFVMYYIKPDCRAPIIGDQDNGRFHPFGLQGINDHRYLLAIGAILFKRRDFKMFSSGYNTDCFFLLGPESAEKFTGIEKAKCSLHSQALPDAGFYIMRDKDNYMFINLSGKGKYNELPTGTHTHSDLLSFELAVGDTSFIVDPGSYIYSANPAERKLFRSTPMHNTVVVDNQNQNILKDDELWNFERNALPNLIEWQSSSSSDTFCAEHTGYLRLKNPVSHRRKIIFVKNEALWTIQDYLSGSGDHTFEWFFHFDIGIDFVIENKRAVTTRAHGTNISLSLHASHPVALHKEIGFVSRSYGHKQKAAVLRVSMQGGCPAWVTTEIRIVREGMHG